MAEIEKLRMCLKNDWDYYLVRVNGEWKIFTEAELGYFKTASEYQCPLIYQKFLAGKYITQVRLGHVKDGDLADFLKREKEVLERSLNEYSIHVEAVCENIAEKQSC